MPSLRIYGAIIRPSKISSEHYALNVFILAFSTMLSVPPELTASDLKNI
jgi:hypothetical protein